MFSQAVALLKENMSDVFVVLLAFTRKQSTVYHSEHIEGAES